MSPLEFGITTEEKLTVATDVIRPFIAKFREDLQIGVSHCSHVALC